MIFFYSRLDSSQKVLIAIKHQSCKKENADLLIRCRKLTFCTNSSTDSSKSVTEIVFAERSEYSQRCLFRTVKTIYFYCFWIFLQECDGAANVFFFARERS